MACFVAWKGNIWPSFWGSRVWIASVCIIIIINIIILTSNRLSLHDLRVLGIVQEWSNKIITDSKVDYPSLAGFQSFWIFWSIEPLEEADHSNGRVVNVSKVLEIRSLSPSSSSRQKHFMTPTDLVVFTNSTRPSSIWLAEHGTNFIRENLIDSHSVIRFPTSSSPFLSSCNDAFRVWSTNTRSV